MDKTQNLFEEFCDSLLVESKLPSDVNTLTKKIDKAYAALEEYQRTYDEVVNRYNIALESGLSTEKYSDAMEELTDHISDIEKAIESLTNEKLRVLDITTSDIIGEEAMNDTRLKHSQQAMNVERHGKILKATQTAADNNTNLKIDTLSKEINRIYVKVKNLITRYTKQPESATLTDKVDETYKQVNDAKQSKDTDLLTSIKNKLNSVLTRFETLLKNKQIATASFTEGDLDEILIALEGAEEVQDSDEDDEEESSEKKTKDSEDNIDYISKAKECITQLKGNALKLLEEKESKLKEDDVKGKQDCEKMRKTLDNIWNDNSDIPDEKTYKQLQKKMGKAIAILTPAMEEIFHDDKVQEQLAVMKSLLMLETPNEEAFNHAMESILDYVDNKIWLQRANYLRGLSMTDDELATESATEEKKEESTLVFDDLEKAKHNLDLVIRMADASIDRLYAFDDKYEVVSLRKQCSDLIARCIKYQNLNDESDINLLEVSKKLLDNITQIDNEISVMGEMKSEDEPEITMTAEEAYLALDNEIAEEGVIADTVRNGNIVVTEANKNKSNIASWDSEKGKELNAMLQEITEYAEKMNKIKSLPDNDQRIDEAKSDVTKYTALINRIKKIVDAYMTYRLEEKHKEAKEKLFGLPAASSFTNLEEYVKDACIVTACEALEKYFGDDLLWVALEANGEAVHNDAFIREIQNKIKSLKDISDQNIRYYASEIENKDLGSLTSWVQKMKPEVTGTRDLEILGNELVNIKNNPDNLTSSKINAINAKISTIERKLTATMRLVKQKIANRGKRNQFMQNVTDKFTHAGRSNAKANQLAEEIEQLKAANNDPNISDAEKKANEDKINRLEMQKDNVESGRTSLKNKILTKYSEHLGKSKKSSKLDRKEKLDIKLANAEDRHREKLAEKDEVRAQGFKSKDNREALVNAEQEIKDNKDRFLQKSEAEKAAAEKGIRAAERKKEWQRQEDIKKRVEMDDADKKKITDEIDRHEKIAEHCRSVLSNPNSNENAKKQAREELSRVNGKIKNLRKQIDVSDDEMEEYTNRASNKYAKDQQKEADDKKNQEISDARTTMNNARKAYAMAVSKKKSKDEIEKLEADMKAAEKDYNIKSGKQAPDPEEEKDEETGITKTQQTKTFRNIPFNVAKQRIGTDAKWRGEIEEWVKDTKTKVESALGSDPDDTKSKALKEDLDNWQKLLDSTKSTFERNSRDAERDNSPEEREARLAREKAEKDAKTEQTKLTKQQNATAKQNEMKNKALSLQNKVKEDYEDLIKYVKSYDNASNRYEDVPNAKPNKKGQVPKRKVQLKPQTIAQYQSNIEKLNDKYLVTKKSYLDAMNAYNSKYPKDEIPGTRFRGYDPIDPDVRDFLADKQIDLTPATESYIYSDFTDEDFVLWCAKEGFDLSDIDEYTEDQIEYLTNAIACRLNDAYIASESFGIDPEVMELLYIPSIAYEAKSELAVSAKVEKEMDEVQKAVENLKKDAKTKKRQADGYISNIRNLVTLLEKADLKKTELGARYLRARADRKDLKNNPAQKQYDIILKIHNDINAMYDNSIWEKDTSARVIKHKVAKMAAKLATAFAKFKRTASKEITKLNKNKRMAKLSKAQRMQIDKLHEEALKMNAQYVSPSYPHRRGTESFENIDTEFDLDDCEEILIVEACESLAPFILEDPELSAYAYETIYEEIYSEVNE